MPARKRKLNRFGEMVTLGAMKRGILFVQVAEKIGIDRHYLCNKMYSDTMSASGLAKWERKLEKAFEEIDKEARG